VHGNVHKCKLLVGGPLRTAFSLQRGPGFGVQWGIYPKVPAVRFIVDIYINNWRIDHKEQAYPPHGSVPARNIASGDIFRLEGQVVNAKGDVGFFYLTCKAA
jgi:hypothetical protein